MEQQKPFQISDDFIFGMYPFFKRHDKELETFKHIIKKTQLDIVQRQIYPVLRNKDKPTESVSIQTSIEGFRLLAERTGCYAPGKDATYEYNENGELIKAISFVKKRTPDGTWHEISASAFMREYKPEYKADFWNKMPHVMLAKVAEAAAIRRAFPDVTGGLYTNDEMAQASIVSEPLIELKQPSEPSAQTMSNDQIEEIEEILRFDATRKERLLNYFNVSDIKFLPNSNFEFIMKTIKTDVKRI